jgi:pimeloyl-ACP methyl ester carboxylesterase
VRQVTSGGVVYERRGSGRPVVLLHGWCLNRRMWTYEEELLARDHDVITPDLPGFGRSDGVAGPYDLAAYADSVQALLAELELSDAVLVGFAFGAAVGMSVAARGDDRVAGIVLVGVTSGAAFPADKMIRSMRRDWPDFARRSAQVLCTRHSDATVSWLEAMFGATALPVAVDAAALLGEFEPEPLAPALPVPALFLHGADDDVTPASLSERCAALAPQGRVTVLPDCGHLAVLDQRQGLHDAVVGFLADVHGTSAQKGA